MIAAEIGRGQFDIEFSFLAVVRQAVAVTRVVADRSAYFGHERKTVLEQILADGVLVLAVRCGTGHWYPLAELIRSDTDIVERIMDAADEVAGSERFFQPMRRRQGTCEGERDTGVLFGMKTLQALEAVLVMEYLHIEGELFTEEPGLSE